jgi:hypothetical protein
LQSTCCDTGNWAANLAATPAANLGRQPGTLPDFAVARCLTKRQAKLDGSARLEQRFPKVFHSLDEMRLAQNKVEVFTAGIARFTLYLHKLKLHCAAFSTQVLHVHIQQS